MTNNETTFDETTDEIIDQSIGEETVSDVGIDAATTISVRELKAHASKLLKLIEEDSRSEIIITRHGRPCGKLVGLDKHSPTAPATGRTSLRNTLTHLAKIEDNDLIEATNIWGSGSNE